MAALIAHRGYPRRYPENTLAGLDAAITTGARYIEVDVQMSADGVPVVFHDGDLERLCGLPGRITGTALTEIRKLRVGGEPVPTLSDLAGLLQPHPGVHAYVELKQESIDVAGQAAMLDAVSDVLAPLRDQCTLISYNVDVLGLATDRGWATGWVTDAWPDALPATLEHRLAVWFCDVTVLPPDGPLNLFAVPLAVYEVADPYLAHQLAGRGAAYIETFDIGGMRRELPGWE